MPIDALLFYYLLLWHNFCIFVINKLDMAKNQQEQINTWSDIDELICPYCGYHYHIDHTEFILSGEELEFDDRPFECPNCEQEYLVMRRAYFTYETYKNGKEN